MLPLCMHPMEWKHLANFMRSMHSFIADKKVGVMCFSEKRAPFSDLEVEQNRRRERTAKSMAWRVLLFTSTIFLVKQMH